MIFPDDMVVDIDIEGEGSEELQLKKFTGNDKRRRFISGKKGNAKRKQALQDEVGL